MYGYDKRKGYKRKSEYEEYERKMPQPTFVTSGKPTGFCYRMPGIVLRCEHNEQCWLCEYADRARVSFGMDPPPHPLIGLNSIIPETAKKQLNYYGKVAALKQETIEKLGFKPLLYFQFFKCVDGFGCHPGNSVWEIEGYLLADKERPITLKRMDILGVPTLTACKRYDRYFFANSVKECGYFEGGGVT